MNNPFKRPPTTLDCLIEDLEAAMCKADVGEEEYQSLVKTYEKMVDIRNQQKRKSIDPNVALTVGANLAGIFAVIKSEQISALSSKVWGLLMRPRS